MKRFSTRTGAVVAAVLAVVVVAVSVTALATAAGKTKVYQACVSKSTGELYKVTSKSAKPTCKSGDKVVSWNQAGPAGPPGASGAAGSPGSPGAAGSSGSAGPAGTAGQSGSTAYGTQSLTMSAASPATVVPGLTQTVTVPTGAFVYVATNGTLSMGNTSAGTYSYVDIYVSVDSATPLNAFYKRVQCINTLEGHAAYCDWSFSGVIPMSAVSHTIEVRADVASGVDVIVSGDNTSVRQGALSVLMLKG